MEYKNITNVGWALFTGLFDGINDAIDARRLVDIKEENMKLITSACFPLIQKANFNAGMMIDENLEHFR